MCTLTCPALKNRDLGSQPRETRFEKYVPDANEFFKSSAPLPAFAMRGGGSRREGINPASFFDFLEHPPSSPFHA